MGKHLLILTPAVLLDGIGHGMIVEVPLQRSVRGGRLDVGPLHKDLNLLGGELSSLTVILNLELFVSFPSCNVHDLFFLLKEVVFALHVLLTAHYAPELIRMRNGTKGCGSLKSHVGIELGLHEV